MLESKTFIEVDEETKRFSNIDISNINVSKDVFGVDEDCNLWYFNRLYTPPQIRNKGYAKKVMEQLTTYLDENDIDLICEINPYGDLNREQLNKFYRGYGFITLMDEVLIRYHRGE